MPYKDKEKRQEYKRQYRVTHKEEERERSRQYYATHKEEKKERNRQHYATHKKAGLCTQCSRPHARGTMLCLLHYDRNRRQARRRYRENLEVRARASINKKIRYYKLKSENKCTDCGLPLDMEDRVGTRCINCSEGIPRR